MAAENLMFRVTKTVKGFMNEKELSTVRRVIVYCWWVKTCVDISNILSRLCIGRRVLLYHGEMSTSDREHVEDEWGSAAGLSSIFMFATSASGCGVDCKGVVAVFHAERP